MGDGAALWGRRDLEVVGLVGSFLVCAVAARKSSSRADGTGSKSHMLFVVGGGGLLISAFRLGAKVVLRKRRASSQPGEDHDTSSFPFARLLRHLWRENLERDVYPRGRSITRGEPTWKRVQQANIHEHEQRNMIYEEELKSRLHEIALQGQLRERIAASRGVSAEEVLVFSQAVDLLITAFCCDPSQQHASSQEEGLGCIMVKAPSHGLYEMVAKVKGVQVIEVPQGEFSQKKFYDIISDRVKLIFISSPSKIGSTPTSLDLIRQYALNAPDALVVVDEMMADLHQQASACSLLHELPNVVVLQVIANDALAAGPRSPLSPRSEVVIAKENVIQTLTMVTETRSRRQSSVIDPSIAALFTSSSSSSTTAYSTATALDYLHQHDDSNSSSAGSFHHKILSGGQQPSKRSPHHHHTNSSVQALEMAHNTVKRHEKRSSSIFATAAGAVNKYL